jgi:hypothetical protein
MRKKLFPIIMASFLTLSLVLVVSAQSTNPQLPGGGWWTGVTVQNVDTKAGTLVLSAYAHPSSGGNDATVDQPTGCSFGPGESLLFNPGQNTDCNAGRIGLLRGEDPGWYGAAQVSTDVKAQAMVQVGNNTLGDVGAGGTAQGFYRGTSDDVLGTALYFIPMKNNYFGQTTHHYIQAAGGDVTVSVVASYHDRNYTTKGTRSDSYNITANDMIIVGPADVGAGVPQNMIGVLLVTVTSGSGKLAGATIEHPHSISGNVAPFALSASALTSTQLDQELFGPTFKKRFFSDGNTGMTIVNPDGSNAATVDVTFTVANVRPGSPADSAGVTPGKTYAINDLQIPAGEDKTISAFNLGDTYGVAMPDGILASVQIVSDLPVAGVMNETNTTFTSGGSAAGKAAYTLFPVGQARTDVSLPLVKEDFFRKTTGLTVVNVGDNPTNVTITFKSSVGNTYTLVKNSLGAKQSITAFRCAQMIGGQCQNFTSGTFLNNSAAVSKRYGVTVESSSEAVIALAQESSLVRALDLGNYEGFSVGTP